jgi:pimeloyl-ACP methyl ester carboxylesterase
MQNLLLLHGATGAASQLKPLAEQLSDNYQVYSLDFTGHGGREDGGSPFSIEMFADDVLQFMAQNNLDQVSVFGYSMGGYVGMYLAKSFPARLQKVVTLATKYQWDETIAAKEIQMLNPEKIEQKLPVFAQSLMERHALTDWKDVLKKTAEMMVSLGADNPLKTTDYTTINTPCLLMLGDRDKMVSLEETISVYKSLPNAQMAILPHTPHPIEQVDTQLLTFLIRKFLD